jgi:hypothetical protein
VAGAAGTFQIHPIDRRALVIGTIDGVPCMTIGAQDAIISSMQIFLVMAAPAIDLYQSLLCEMFISGYCCVAVSAACLAGVHAGHVSVRIDLKSAFAAS